MKRKSIVRTVLSVSLLLAATFQTGVSAGSSGNPGGYDWSLLSAIAPVMQQIQLLSGSVGEGDIWGVQPVADRSPERDTTLILSDPSAPQRFYISQNTPNPFRASTSITYGLPAPTWVRITIHSMLGAEVMTIVNEPQKGGVYTVQFSEPDLQPGIYFYRIETDYGLLTRRMTISR